MADPLRNEIEIQFGGKAVAMRATVDAIRGIESDLKKGIIKVIKDFGNADVGVSDIVSVIFHGLKGGENDVSVESVAAEVMAIGIQPASSIAMEFLLQALNGPQLGKSQVAGTVR